MYMYVFSTPRIPDALSLALPIGRSRTMCILIGFELKKMLSRRISLLACVGLALLSYLFPANALATAPLFT